MPRVAEGPNATGTPLYRMMSHHPKILEKFIALRNAYWEEGIIEPKLKEEVRLLAANLNGCEHCKAVRTDWAKEDGAEESILRDIQDFESQPERFTERQLAALYFTQSFCFNLGWVDDDVFERARKQFDDAEIVELVFCLWQFVGGNFFMHALDIKSEGELTAYYGGELRDFKRSSTTGGL